MDSDTVTIVGAGLAGAACAVELRQAGVPVRVFERGRAPGGRLASPLLHQRRTDLGAGYFTVRDEEFAALVEGWVVDGLARPWTDTFAVLSVGQPIGSASGPMRWATPDGLRSLVRSLLDGIDVQTGFAVESLPDGMVVLAMPDPQAARLVTVPDQVECDPVVAVACGYDERTWPFETAAFVNDHAVLTFVADDGSRRGDGAPVLVAHTSADLAREHLDEPDRAIAPVVQALQELLDVPPPAWTAAHRWTFAKPTGRHHATFGLVEDGRIGLAGDQWCPDGSPRVESAWRSGTDLGRAIAGRR
jgi:renalase